MAEPTPKAPKLDGNAAKVGKRGKNKKRKAHPIIGVNSHQSDDQGNDPESEEEDEGKGSPPPKKAKQTAGSDNDNDEEEPSTDEYTFKHTVAIKLPKHLANVYLPLSAWRALCQATDAIVLMEAFRGFESANGKAVDLQTIISSNIEIGKHVKEIAEAVMRLERGQNDLNWRVANIHDLIRGPLPDPAILAEVKATRMARERASQLEFWEDLTPAAQDKRIREIAATITPEEVQQAVTTEEDTKLATPQPKRQQDSDEAGPSGYANGGGGPDPMEVRSHDLHLTDAKRQKKSPNSCKIPAPVKFGGRLDSDVTCARTWLQLLRQYVAAHGEDFLTLFPFFLKGDAQKWGTLLYEDLKHKNNLMEATVCSEFLQSYANMHRPNAIEARDKLMNSDKWHMKLHEPFSTYVQGFKSIIREAGNMQMEDQIAWFLHGMPPTLRKACAVQTDGKPWLHLDDLIAYGYGQETITKMQSTNSGAPAVLAAMNMPNNRGRGGRKSNRGGRHHRAQTSEGWEQISHSRGRGGSRGGYNGHRGGRGYSGGRGEGGGMRRQPRHEPNKCSDCGERFEGDYKRHILFCPVNRQKYGA